MLSYRTEIKWSEQDEYGYEHVVGEAFGYPVRITVGPYDDGFMWRVTMLNQMRQPGQCTTREAARAAALRCAADWLLFQVVDERHCQRVRIEDTADRGAG